MILYIDTKVNVIIFFYPDHSASTLPIISIKKIKIIRQLKNQSTSNVKIIFINLDPLCKYVAIIWMENRSEFNK